METHFLFKVIAIVVFTASILGLFFQTESDLVTDKETKKKMFLRGLFFSGFSILVGITFLFYI